MVRLCVICKNTSVENQPSSCQSLCQAAHPKLRTWVTQCQIGRPVTPSVRGGSVPCSHVLIISICCQLLILQLAGRLVFDTISHWVKSSRLSHLPGEQLAMSCTRTRVDVVRRELSLSGGLRLPRHMHVRRMAVSCTTYLTFPVAD